MIVERSTKDRYILGDWMAPTNAATSKQDLFTAIRPQKLRVRNLKFAIRASQNTVNWVGTVFAVVLVPQGFTAGSVFVPTAAGVDDVYEPASNVIYADNIILEDTNAGTGPGTVHIQWLGDGKLIDLKVGDKIAWVAKTDESSGSLLRILLDLDIVK